MKIRLVCLPAPDSSVGRASDSRFMGPRHKSWSGLLLFLLSLNLQMIIYWSVYQYLCFDSTDWWKTIKCLNSRWITCFQFISQVHNKEDSSRYSSICYRPDLAQGKPASAWGTCHLHDNCGEHAGIPRQLQLEA